jgi:hypothetical protein
MDGLLLRKGGRTAARQDAGHAGRRDGSGAAGKLDHATTLGIHDFSLPSSIASFGRICWRAS